MALRPVFVPLVDRVGVKEVDVEFTWHPGMSITQKRKTISSLHNSTLALGYEPVLEISSKSPQEVGCQLSAFNLVVTTKSQKQFTVETAFQGSKVFEHGGPYRDLIGMDSRSAKKDARLQESGNLTGFDFFGRTFPLEPRTLFYDWLYINAVAQEPNLTAQIVAFRAFTDIEFNPERSINCQARSAALLVSLMLNRMLSAAIQDLATFHQATAGHYARASDLITVQQKVI